MRRSQEGLIRANAAGNEQIGRCNGCLQKEESKGSLGKWQDPGGRVAPAKCRPNPLGLRQQLETQEVREIPQI